jgi:hypothetical protein
MSAALLRSRHGLLLVLGAGIATSLLLALLLPRPLVIVSSNASFKISAKCTFGADHVYFYGDGLDNFLDPAIKRWTDTNAYRLRYHADQKVTVLWLRLIQRDSAKLSAVASSARMPEGGYSRLRARLIDTRGAETILPTNGRLQYYRPLRTGGCYVEGWVLPKSLEDYRGSTLHIEAPDGMSLASFRVR